MPYPVLREFAPVSQSHSWHVTMISLYTKPREFASCPGLVPLLIDVVDASRTERAVPWQQQSVSPLFSGEWSIVSDGVTTFLRGQATGVNVYIPFFSQRTYARGFFAAARGMEIVERARPTSESPSSKALIDLMHSTPGMAITGQRGE